MLLNESNELHQCSDVTQALVETVFYGSLEQRIVGITIRQKYREVLASISGDEVAA